MSDQPRWVVTTSADSTFAEVVSVLSDGGLQVDQRLDDIGVVLGRCDAATAERLRGLSCVADVSPETPVDIGPPGGGDTW